MPFSIQGPGGAAQAKCGARAGVQVRARSRLTGVPVKPTVCRLPCARMPPDMHVAAARSAALHNTGTPCLHHPQAPDDAVDFFVSRGASLDPRRLLPALARFGEPGSDTTGRAAALRYVRFAIEGPLRCTDRHAYIGHELHGWAKACSCTAWGWRLQVKTVTRNTSHANSTVHNLAVALLSSEPDETPLVEYLSHTGRNALGRPLYDPKYALRLARDRDRWAADCPFHSMCARCHSLAAQLRVKA